LTSGKPNASLLEQFSISKLATRRKLPTDHPYQPQVGSDESLPSQRSLLFEESQLLVRRVCEAGRYSCITCQQASLYRALQLDNFAMCQQRFVGRIVGNFGHAGHSEATGGLATPTNPKSVDNPARRDAATRTISQSSAPMLRVCKALRRASSTTSSENIWLYLCCASTGFVRCNLDFSAAIVRMTVSN
jgi:hypothetical protein